MNNTMEINIYWYNSYSFKLFNSPHKTLNEPQGKMLRNEAANDNNNYNNNIAYIITLYGYISANMGDGC